MIKFFRKIRQNLLSENKFSKYLFYALGEIILVVVGILIALSINNWKEEKQLNKLEKSTLNALIAEFETNRISLRNYLDILKEDMMFADSVRMQLGPNKPTLSIDEMNKWFGQIGATTRCEISTDILEDVRSSGNLKIISEADIRRSIGRWTSSLQVLQREEDDWAREFSAEFYPYTNKWLAWDDVDKISSPNHPRNFKSKFEIDPRIMLQEFEFSNIMSIHNWRMERVNERTEKLLKLTEKALELIKTEIKKNKG
ncbi:hypothetical protein NA63_2240 [Flavobacteriaceae bacterium MAR_2010_105]|nr:hypothetical protein NA63_2240 [Flavobacteriaceae bacterium MAR_2010_105]